MKQTYVEKNIELHNKKNPHRLLYETPPINSSQSDMQHKHILN
jgi:hypothetical protein